MVTDYLFNPKEPAMDVNVIAEFYWNYNTKSGEVKIRDLAHGKTYRFSISNMYTNFVKGVKVYYFDSADGKYKFSTSLSENGFAWADRKSKTITTYAYY